MIGVFHKTYLLVVVAVFSCTGFSTRSAAAELWTKIESPNFELIGNAQEPQMAAIAKRLERFRTVVHGVFSIQDRALGSKIRLVVFKDAASFRPFKPKLADGTPDDLARGYFLSGDDVDYIAVAADGNLSEIFHEYSHALLAKKYGPGEIPPWLNEGLAEYLGTFRELDDRSIEFGSIHIRHLRTLQTGQLMPWDKLLLLDNFSLQQSGPGARAVFYAQSWALVHFLINKKGDVPISDVVESLAKTQDVSAKKIAGLDIAALDTGVRDLIAQKTPISANRRLQSDSTTLSSAAVALSDARSNAYLGDLLYHLRDDAAENYISRSLSLEPDLGMPNATLGLVRLRQRKFAEAKMLLERALAVEQKNFLVNYYYAFLLSREYMDEFGGIERLPGEAAVKIRSRLNGSIALNPEFANSYGLLALVGLITGEDLDAALAAALRAATLRPSNEEYSMLAARIYARLNRMAEAKSIAEKILRNSASSYLRKEAAAIIEASDKLTAASNLANRISIRADTGESRRFVFLKWRDLTPEQIANINQEREINNLNLLIDQPLKSERLAVGSIERITCANERISFRFRTADGVLHLTTRSFDDLKLKVLTPGTRSFVFRCGTAFSSELAVARYRPADQQNDSAGMLSSITFVPKNFRLKPREQIAREPFVIIEGTPPADLDENLRASQAERIEMERVFRESQLDEINEQLRQPEASESRMVAVPQTVACEDGMMLISARAGNVVYTFRSRIAQPIHVRSFTPDALMIDVGCRVQLPPLTAVITYRVPKVADGIFDLVAIEFVPKAFRFK
ncbi:MAG: tetratricopeptide repeat protein [Pyrinomonadaceae bacterium]